MYITMELKQLRLFVLVAEEGGFRRAAERAHMAQPPLSRHIRLLEEEVGTALFSRTSTGAILTDAGRVFLPHAIDILAKAETARVDARRAGRGETGRLAIGFVGPAMDGALPDVIRAFRSTRPAIFLEMIESSTADQFQALEDRRIDVGFVRRTNQCPDGLKSELFMREHYVLAVPDGHRLAQHTVIKPADLVDEPFIFYPRSLFPELYDTILEQLTTPSGKPIICAETLSKRTTVALVAAGIGLSLVPKSTGAHPRRGVVFRTIDAELPYVEMDIITRNDAPRPLLTVFLQTAHQFRHI
ncbi:LysR substrate-binding domain-containing protein [Desulfovibrio inopinatus]|uniref:LysR substrate-binding domain-containing protein n=1 Tax=Desulfovibrio inopinatus TaxID=102109 RepID=UPI000685C8C8|nr:LysR substrate-binding domain-containing protein [Desulfovibrio inopinatus]